MYIYINIFVLQFEVQCSFYNEFGYILYMQIASQSREDNMDAETTIDSEAQFLDGMEEDEVMKVSEHTDREPLPFTDPNDSIFLHPGSVKVIITWKVA